MDSVIKDFDKAFESFSNKIKDKFSKEEAIVNLNKDDFTTKFFKIIKFGGYMGISDYENEIAEALGRDDELSMLFGSSIQWYLDNCAIKLPFEFKIFESLNQYFEYQIVNMNSEYFDSMNLSPRFVEFMSQESRRKGFIVTDDADKDSKKIDFNALYDYLENEDELYLVTDPNELYSVHSNVDIFPKDHCKLGDFYFKYNVDEDVDGALHRFSISFCRYLEEFFPRYYEVFSGKILRLFDSLSHSANRDCAKAMNESFVDKIKDKFSFDREQSKFNNVDPLYHSVEEAIQELYDQKIAELGGTSSDRDLVSGLMTANKYLKRISSNLPWHVEVIPASKSDPVFFDNKKNFRIARSNSFIEERFMSKMTYGKLKRQYRISKDYFNNKELYYTIIDPVMPKMSNKDKFKIGFVLFNAGMKLTIEETIQLCYKILSYMRDNLDRDEWTKIEEQINK